jgi:large subunit ribosomal protein L9
LKGTKAPIIRQASESGQLYGSVSSRDIAAQISEVSGVKVERTMIRLNDNFKNVGLFEVEVALHPEVIVSVTVNIARTSEEAQIQADTGRALIADADSDIPMEEVIEEIKAEAEADDSNLQDVLEDSALESEKAKKEKAAVKAVEDEEKATKSAEKAAKKAAKKAEEEADAAEDEDATTEIG